MPMIKNNFIWFIILLYLLSFYRCSGIEETGTKLPNKSSLNLVDHNIMPHTTYTCSIHSKDLKDTSISENVFNRGLNLLSFGSVILIVSLGILCKPNLVITVVLTHIIIVLFCHWYFILKPSN
jgi:hypothetical protein